MAQELRFDGRTAIITGAGGNPSLGRAHALLLAARGANVVVNDIGSDPESPEYADSASAEAVAEEIRAAGGKAVADTHSVADPDGARAMVQTALDAFGGLDILVNNAGLCLNAGLTEMTERDYVRHMEINLLGSIWTVRAAWSHMQAQGYGRIVNIASPSLAGYANQVAYSASKGGVWSMTRAMAAEGRGAGIKVNAINPGAYTRMVISAFEEDSPVLQYSRDNYPAELSSPAVAYLCHEDCPVTGECIESIGGQVQRTYMQRTAGFSDAALTIEDVAQRWDEVMATDGAVLVEPGDVDTSGWKNKPYRG